MFILQNTGMQSLVLGAIASATGAAAIFNAVKVLRRTRRRWGHRMMHVPTVLRATAGRSGALPRVPEPRGLALFRLLGVGESCCGLRALRGGEAR